MITKLNTLKQTLTRLLSLALPFCAIGTFASAATSLSQFGITWTFDRDYQTGQFANGDYWVVGPVKVINITPKSNGTMHGSMINPGVNSSQGYDSRIKYNTYSSSLNAGLGLPRTIPAGSSLLSAKSYSTSATNNAPQLETIAILTVVGSAPPAGSFRPPYIGTDKTIRWNKSQLNYSKLRSLAPVSSTPALSTLEASFERPWIEQKTNWTGRFMHPKLNQPDYGREMAYKIGDGMLALQLNYSNAQKEKLLARMVQYGIDIYGAARAGAVWSNDGGHNHGRKGPLVLAGTLLGDANILAYANGTTKRIFQEDQQTWYVTQSDVGRPLYHGDGRPRVEYIQADVGIPEWGEKHYTTPSRDGRNWDTYYRNIVGPSIMGHVLAARLMGVESTWNWPALFGYIDRYWNIEKGDPTGGANRIGTFVHAMWSAYRSGASNVAPAPTEPTEPTVPTEPEPTPIPEESVATEVWESTSIAAQTGTFTLAFDMMASANNIDGVTGLSNGAVDGYSDLAAIVRFNTSGAIDARNGSSYQAVNAFQYTAGVKYHVLMTVDVATKRYSVKVNAPGAAAVTIADNYAFRTEQATVSQLNNVGYLALNGSHAVLNVALQGQATTLPINTTSSTTFTNTAMPAQSGSFTVSFDATPSSSSIDAVTALAPAAANGYGDLAAIVRFSLAGVIDARNGSTYAAATPFTYAAGVTYRFDVSVNVPAHTYSVKVTRPGGTPVTIANNWAFRTAQAAATSLTTFTLKAGPGTHTVKNVSLTTN